MCDFSMNSKAEAQLNPPSDYGTLKEMIGISSILMQDLTVTMVTCMCVNM